MTLSQVLEIWRTRDEARWGSVLDNYWLLIKPENLQLEREMEKLNPADVLNLSAQDWYVFLFEKYFRWKYTARNRYGSTTKQLRRYIETGSLDELNRIRQDLLAFDPSDIEKGLTIATSIHGLGTAGASGLLSVLFPTHFGTVDQFLVRALRQINDLPEVDVIRRMNPQSLTIRNGVLLIELMRAKAHENNRVFGTKFWTPRRIDMVLWTLGH